MTGKPGPPGLLLAPSLPSLVGCCSAWPTGLSDGPRQPPLGAGQGGRSSWGSAGWGAAQGALRLRSASPRGSPDPRVAGFSTRLVSVLKSSKA